jgi:hypothetical protein
MDQTVQVCIVTWEQIWWRRGRRGTRSPLPFPVEQFCLCTPVCHSGHCFNEGIDLRVGGEGRLTYFETRSESDAPACPAAH